MTTLLKCILVAGMCVLGCGTTTKAQTALQWEQITDDLLGDVDLSERLPIDLGGLQFVDDKTGFITTRNGEIIRTDDGGSTWKLFYADFTGQGGYFNEGGYYFFDKNVWFNGPSRHPLVWARTLDSGKHWEFSDNKTCPDVVPFFLRADVGWGISVSSICATKDGGKSWTVIAQHPDGVNSLGEIFMLDDTHGWITGDERILATSDGLHWSTRFQDASISVSKIHFFSPTQGYLRGKTVGSKGTTHKEQRILFSNDGGQRWESSAWNGAPGGEPQGFSNIVIEGNGDVWVIGYFSKADSPGTDTVQRQYHYFLFHSGNRGASFESAGKLPDHTGFPKSIAVASQQGKAVLLMLDVDGALWRAHLAQ